MGKFLVKDSVNYQWKEGETRVIGGYNCFKATTVRPASKLILEILDLRKKILQLQNLLKRKKQISWII
jgi:GLPGLI family protein